MFNRLKALPLTILLTILIWMYAEAQFTNTQENVQISVKLVTPSPDLALRALDPVKNRASDTINAVVTLQGPRTQLDAIFQQSQGVPDEELASLSWAPRPRDVRAGEDSTVDVVTMLNSLSYFRSRHVTIISAAPPRISLEVDQMLHLSKAPEFRPATPLDRAVLSDDAVTVNIPAGALDRLGGPGKIAVVAEPQRSLATLPPGTDQTLPVKYVADYPGVRDDRITISPLGGSVNVHIPAATAATEIVPDVPVWTSGPPALLSKYDVETRPRLVRVTVAGAPAALAAFHDHRNDSSGGGGVHAYIDLTPDDTPTDGMIRRRLRYTLPDGLSLQGAPADVEFRLTAKPAPTTQESPATTH